MKRPLIVALALVFNLIALPLQAQSELQPLLITEVLTGSAASGSYEYVEIYNPNNRAYPLANIALEYATKIADDGCPNWRERAAFHATAATQLPPRGFGLLATDTFLATEYPNLDVDQAAASQRTAKLNAGLVDNNRSLRLVTRIDNQAAGTPDATQTTDLCSQTIAMVHDRLGWGRLSPDYEGEPFFWLAENGTSNDHLPTGYSLKRLNDEDGLFVDTDHNNQDFALSDAPLPQITPPEPTDDNNTEGPNNQPPEHNDDTELPAEQPPEPDDPNQNLPGTDDQSPNNSNDNANDNQPPEPDDTPQETPAPTPESPKQYPKLVISELLPDPAKPQTDAEHEFVELYNPNDKPVELSGYVIQTGANLQYEYQIADIIIQPRGFQAFFAARTGLILPNSGGRVQLLAPNGTIAADLVRYENAPAGQSWSRIQNIFQWSDRLTPGKANLPPLPEPPKPNHNNPGSSSANSSVPFANGRVANTDSISYPKVLITELLPDPAPPSLDADDEFVELYNPNDFAVKLDGWRLKTGSTLRSSTSLDGIQLKAGQRIALFAADYTISLANKGGQAQLVAPNGQAVSQAKPYSAAPEGEAWALIQNRWHWTARPTPAATNELVASASGANSKAGQQLNQVRSTAPASNQLAAALAQPAAIPLERANLRLVAVSGSLALLYGLYEYRHDLRARFRQLREYYAHWRRSG